MKQLLTIIILSTLFSCSSKKDKVIDKQKTKTTHKLGENSVQVSESRNTPARSPIIIKYDPQKFKDSVSNRLIQVIKEYEGIPPSGTYIYDTAYAKWQGRSMGEKVRVVIKGHTIKITSEGNPSMTAKKGKILDQGILVKHNETGDWLISNNPSDANLEAYGGCVEEPMVIDFVNKKYITC